MPERKHIRNLDLYVPNFDLFLLDRIGKMTPEQREIIPAELKIKIFKKKEASVSEMNFIEKMYLYSVCFKKAVVVSAVDEEAGLSQKEYNLAVKAQKGKAKNQELLNELEETGTFVLSNKELMQSWQYINYVQCSEIYELIRSVNPNGLSKREQKLATHVKNFSGLVRTIVNHEGRKKDVLINFGISMPKYYALLYFYDGEKKGTLFYREAFKHAYTSNRGDLSGAMAELYQDGYLDRRGANKNMSYFITAKGIELLTRVINKLVFNY